MRLDISFASALIKNYAKNHWATINKSCPSIPQSTNSAPMQDSRSVWFSLADLQDFINEFEDAGNQENLGVRVYFGEYSADLLGSNDNGQYNGLHTLVMVPTILGKDGLNHDFDPATSDSDFSHSSDICALNHGTLTPPPFYVNGSLSGQTNVGQDFMIFCDNNSQS